MWTFAEIVEIGKRSVEREIFKHGVIYMCSCSLAANVLPCVRSIQLLCAFCVSLSNHRQVDKSVEVSLNCCVFLRLLWNARTSRRIFHLIDIVCI